VARAVLGSQPMFNTRNVQRSVCAAIAVVVAFLANPSQSGAQGQTRASKIVVDVGMGFELSLNGNVNSGAIGRLQGQATAILPNAYGDIYGNGLNFRFGVGYVLNELTEGRATFTIQTADADLVRLGDIGPSSLYAQYSDYKTFGMDFGLRRYFFTRRDVRVFAEGTIGFASIDAIDATLAAPQANIVIEDTVFYDSSASFAWGINGGVVFRFSEKLDLTGQLGLRRVGGLAEVEQFEGTGLEDINNDSGRLTFPIVVGVRLHF
jgi:hypothetical protein